MATTVKRRYCFLYPKGEEKNLTGDVLNAYKLLNTPYVYKTAQYNYELVIDEEISNIANYINLQDYDIFWELIYKLLTDESFIINQLYLNYNASDLQKDTNYIEFKRNDQEWKIYLSYSRLENEYPSANQYFVFYDTDDHITQLEMYGALSYLCDNLGKDNKYNAVKEYVYQDVLQSKRFYIFYYGSAPSDDVCRQQIRITLNAKIGYAAAKAAYPNLYIDNVRKIYLLYDNNAYSISYESVKTFVDNNGIDSPEIILLLDWRCPLLIDNGGVSDVIPNYSPIEENDNILSNEFLMIVSKCLNYLDGTVLTPTFKQRINFVETSAFISFIFQGIEWRIQKWTYQAP